MRVLIQRSKNSYVKVKNKIIGKIDEGFVIFVGFKVNDNIEVINKMIEKILNLRIFNDNNKLMNESILMQKKSVLSISQFTLYADTKKGNRPSYKEALNYQDAQKLYNYFNEKLSKYVNVETGIFGEDMEVHIINDGPVTIFLER